ncbi:T9SS type A sorting domain-containing protein [Luteibaculum oceani]|uniref:T9SS type A sorting domain-containing protein n=1 Tax=Luteibaculum oceani TaxID=1294296 RepID=A0A5C6UYT3_9FLAO|nr:T9SS type A sorting domain-containing protein [Luteibaculum oceani]TXC78457.1 T9SS type A sorting domain-containing protein [Luteibaculum oceani]
MKKYYNLMLLFLALVLGSTAYGQVLPVDCPTGIDITAGAKEVSGSDFVCDGTTVTVTWTASTSPDVTGYRLRVGNNATIDNLSATYVEHTGPGTYSSTFAVPAATNGDFYSYTVDASGDQSWTIANAATRVYEDCIGNAQNFKVSIDPSNPIFGDVTSGDDGAANTVCINGDFDVTVNGGALGDLGAYYIQVIGGASSGNFLKSGTNAVISLTADPDTFTTAGTYDFNIAIADSFCSVNYPIATSVDLASNGGNLTIRDIFQIDGVTTTDDGAIASGDTICFDGSGTDAFGISFSAVLAGAVTGDVYLSTDSGASFTPVLGQASPYNGQLIGAENTDYAFYVSDAAFCQATIDTFRAETFDNAGAAPANSDLEYSTDGGTTYSAYTGAIAGCDGVDVTLKFDASAFAGDLGNNENVAISWDFDMDAGGTYGAGETDLGSATLASGTEFTYTLTGLTAGNTYIARVRVTDACDGAAIFQGTDVTVNVNAASSAGTTSELSLTREDNTTSLTSGNKVCSNELLDIDLALGDGALGTNGEVRIYKITATDTTDLTSAATVVGVGPADTLQLLDHNHGSVPATYHGVIVSDCDSITVAVTPSILVNVYNSSGGLTSVAFAGTSLDDFKACPSESITLQATPTTLGDDSPQVEFFASSDSTLDGTDISLGTGSFSGGSYNLTVTYGNTNVYYIAELTSFCSGDTLITNRIIPHTSNVDPSDFNISASNAGGNDLDTDTPNDTVDGTNIICIGDSVYLMLTDGTLADDGSMFVWEIDSTGSWVVLATDTNKVGIKATVDMTKIRVKIDSGSCGYVGAYHTSLINLRNGSDVPTFVSFEEDNGSTVTVSANDSICDGNDLVISYMTGANLSVEDTAVVYVKENGVIVNASITPIGDSATSSTYEMVIPTASITAGNTYQLFFSSYCGGEDTISTAYTINYYSENANVAALTAEDQFASPLTDGAYVCDDKVITFSNGGTLGNAGNYNITPEFVFEADTGSGFYEAARGAASSFMVSMDTLPSGFVTVRSYLDGSCSGATASTADFTVNLYDAQNNFTNISLTNDNYCANEADMLSITMTANGATLVNDGFTRVVWYSIDDQGDPVNQIKSTLAGTAGADKLFLFPSGGDVVAPDSTTTIGVRLESCDTTAFEVRIITVKDTSKIDDAVASASPNAVCAGATSTLTLINYDLGANGKVVWYAADETTVLGNGPSYTTAPITVDSTWFKVRLESDCDTTAFDSVMVRFSTQDPTAVTDISPLPAVVCEDEVITLDANGSTGDGSYIWEVSFNGTVYSSISDATPGDTSLKFTAADLDFDANGESTVIFRVSRTNGCITTTTTSGSLTVREIPVALTGITASDDELCINESPVTVNVSGGDAGYDGMIKWYIQKQGGADSAVTAWDNMMSVSFDWNMFDGAGVYDIWAQYESASCGSYTPDSVLTTVKVNALPTNDLTNPIVSVCSNDEVSLKGLSGYTHSNESYVFSGPGVADTMYVAANGSFAGSATGGTETIDYTVTRNGCSQTFQVEIEVNGKPTIGSATATIASCSVDDGTIKVETVTGGTAPFTFAVDGETAFGFAADSTITGLSGGLKDVLVMDANGCTSDAFQVTVPSSNNYSLVVDTVIQESCFEADNGQIEVSVSGGLAPYSYTVLKDGNTFAGPVNNVSAGTYVFGSLEPGVYQFIFTDNAGCQLSETRTIDPAGQIGLTVNDFQDINCFGDATGYIAGLTATSTNNGPFEFSLNGGTFSSDTAFNNLTAGDYEITVRDSKGCQRTFLFTLDEPTLLTLEPVVFDTSATEGYDVRLDAAGGVSPYEYSDGGAYQSGNIYENLPGGTTYTFVVRDDNGCMADSTITLDEIVSVVEFGGVFAGVSAYPNPFSDEITVHGVTNDVEISFIDVAGKSVDYMAVVKDNKATITTNAIPAGVYFIKLRKANDAAVIKVVKQ